MARFLPYHFSVWYIDVLYFFSVYWLRVSFSVIAICVAKLFWNKNPYDISRPKLQKLANVEVIPATRLNADYFDARDRLVIIQDGCVTPLSRVSSLVEFHPIRTRAGYDAVFVKAVEYTNQAKEFEGVFKGTRHVSVSSIPFVIHSGYKNWAVVRKVDADHLPLTHEWSEPSEFDPAITLTHTVVKRYEGNDKNYKEQVVSRAVQVKKVREESVLRDGVKLQNVFGVLSKRDGILEIQPSPDFPKNCFNMSQDEIRMAVLEKARADCQQFRSWSFLLCLVFIGLLSSFFY